MARTYFHFLHFASCYFFRQEQFPFVAQFAVIVTFLLPAFDYRFGWSHVPMSVDRQLEVIS